MTMKKELELSNLIEIDPNSQEEQTNDYGLNDSTIEYTVGDAIETIGFGKYQIAIVLIAGFSWMADGMEIMALSILGPTLECEWNISPLEESLITSEVFMGFLVGSFVFGFISDKYGRKTALIGGTLVVVIFGILSAFSHNIYILYVLRFMVGFGVGGTPQSVTYISEQLPTSARGRCVVLLEVLWALGSIVEVLLAWWLIDRYNWNVWLGATASTAVLFLIFSFFLPESPRFKMISNDRTDAFKTLSFAAKCNNVTLPEGVLVNEQQVPRGKIKDLFLPDVKSSSFMLSYLWFASGFTYYGAVLFTTELLQVGNTCEDISNTTALQCPAFDSKTYIELLWTSSAELPGILLTFIIIDVLGRKKSLILTYSSFTVGCLLLLICLDETPMVVILFFIRAMVASAFQILYVYTPELYSTEVRGLSVGVAAAFARIGAIITPYIADILLKTHRKAGFAIYSTVAGIAVVVSILLPYETKGKQFKESHV